MNLPNKSSLINFCFKRFSSSFFSGRELGLHAGHRNYLNNSLRAQPIILNNLNKHKILFVPDRKLMNSYFALSVRKKIEDTYDSIRFFGREEEKLLGFKWYSKIDDLNYIEFLTIFQLEDSFYSWFKVQELHTWMLLFFLPQQNRPQKITRMAVVQAMWLDTERRCDVLAPQNRNRKKDLRALYERFQVTLFLYDDGYFNTDKELFSALWYNFFEGENVDPRLIEVLVSYVRYQINHLNNIEIKFETVDDKKLILWTPLKPHYDKVFNKI